MRAIVGVLAFGVALATIQAAEIPFLKDPDEQIRRNAIKVWSKNRTKLEADEVRQLVEVVREDPAPAVRRDAIFMLSYTTQERGLAVAALLEVASDRGEYPRLRAEAISTLTRVGQQSNRVIETLLVIGSEPAFTEGVVNTLVKLGAKDRLDPLLQHKNPAVSLFAKGQFMRLLGEASPLDGILNEDAQVRQASVIKLGSRPRSRGSWTQEELTKLHKGINSPDHMVQSQCLQILRDLGENRKIVPELVQIVKAKNSLSMLAAQCLITAGDGVAAHIQDLKAIYEDPELSNYRMQILQAMGEAEREAKPVLPILLDRVKNGTPNERWYAAMALRKAGHADPDATFQAIDSIPGQKHEQLLVELRNIRLALIRDPVEIRKVIKTGSFRDAMAHLPALVRLGDGALDLIPDVVDLLARQPKGPPNVILASNIPEIANELGKLGPKILPKMLAYLDSKVADERTLAFYVINQLGIDALPALDRMTEMATGDDVDVRRAALGVLEQLGYRARPAIPKLLDSFTKNPSTAIETGNAIAWIGCTGDDAKKVRGWMVAPPKGYNERAMHAVFASLGPSVANWYATFIDGLQLNDPLRQRLTRLQGIADRPKLIQIELDNLANPNLSNPQASINVLLRSELTAEQRDKLARATLLQIQAQPHAMKPMLLRLLGAMGAEARPLRAEVLKLEKALSDDVRLAATECARRLQAN